MKKLAFLFTIVSLLVFVGCSSVSPLCATSNELGVKVGESTAGFLFGAIPMFGADAGIQKAARNAGISKISTVDVKTTTYFGWWTSVTTIVTGE